MNPQLDFIINIVCDETGLDYNELISTDRHRFRADARKIYFYAARENTKMSLACIGGHIGKDHATVMHGIRVLKNILPYSPQIRYTLERVMDRVKVVSKVKNAESIPQL